VEDGGASFFSPAYVRPSQWRDQHRNGDDPIKNLFRALLEISLRDATGVRRAAKGRRRTRSRSAAILARAEVRRSQCAAALRRDALGWIFDESADGPFSFQNVCDVLEIDAERGCARGCGCGWAKSSGCRRREATSSTRRLTLIPNGGSGTPWQETPIDPHAIRKPVSWGTPT